MSSEAIVLKLATTGPVTSFTAADEVSAEVLKEVPTDRESKLVITVPRNLKFHKKFFALLKVIVDYMDEETRLRHNIFDSRELLQRLKIDLGLYSLHIMGPNSTLPEGTCVYVPDSISFGKMDETKFAAFYKAVIGVAIAKYTTAQTEDSMMQAVNAVLRFE